MNVIIDSYENDFEIKVTTVHATIAQRSYAERAASLASSTVINLTCNPRPHGITQRVLTQHKIVQQLWHGL